jgi:hypothetical protein
MATVSTAAGSWADVDLWVDGASWLDVDLPAAEASRQLAAADAVKIRLFLRLGRLAKANRAAFSICATQPAAIGVG